MRNDKAFTLIEMLTVVVIVGVLAGILIAVIDPARQRQRAAEAALREITEKACFALKACGAAEVDARRCNTWVDINVMLPASTLPGTLFDIQEAPTGDPDASVIITSWIPSIEGGNNRCAFRCSYSFASTAMIELTEMVSIIPPFTFGRCIID